MVRMKGNAFGLFVPALSDVFIGSEPVQCLEAHGKVIGHPEGLEGFREVLVGLVVVLPHGGVFAGPVHAFPLAIGPGMVGCGEAMGATLFLADASEEMGARVLSALPGGALEAVIGQHGVDLVGYGGDQVAQDLRSAPLARFGVQRRIDERADAVDRDEHVVRPLFRTALGTVELAGTKRIRSELLLSRLVAFNPRSAAASAPPGHHGQTSASSPLPRLLG